MRQITASDITDINRKYHNHLAPVYDTYQEQNHPKVIALYRDMLSEIFSHLKKSRDGRLRILDFGCGTGFMEQYLFTEKNGVTGIDVSQKSIARARKKYPKARYIVRDVYSFTSGGRYDLIVENAVLHHLKGYNDALDHLTGLLRPGGVLFLGAEPNYFCYKYLWFLKELFRNSPWDYRLYKTKKIKQELEQLAEYHMYNGNGIHPYVLRDYLKQKGFRRVDIRFSSREFMAGLIDRFHIPLINAVPAAVLDVTGILSRIFYVTAYK